MEESTTLQLKIEKGPREGETLEYTSRSVVKIGRVVRGNTIAIKDAGISSKHICIQFDKDFRIWTLSDLDSSNGTILNGQTLEPNVPSDLNDGDCIKIGELTSIIVKIGAANVAETGRSGLGLDVDLGKNAVGEPVEKRVLRSRAKKPVDSKNEVGSSNSKRTLRSSKKEEKVSFTPTLNQIPENSNVVINETTDLSVPIESKKTRGGRKKLPVQLPVNSDLNETQPADIVVPIDGRRTRRGRKGLPLENVQNNGVEEIVNNANESVPVDEGNDATFDKYPVQKVENSGLEENLDTNDESALDHVAEKLGSMQESCKGKQVAEDLECGGNSSQDLVKNTGPDNGQWLDLEKMTLGDFFDYLEVHLAKEIYDKSEKIISDLAEKTRKYHEFRLQRNENASGTLATD